jgi:hypothetical protein
MVGSQKIKEKLNSGSKISPGLPETRLLFLKKQANFCFYPGNIFID